MASSRQRRNARHLPDNKNQNLSALTSKVPRKKLVEAKTPRWQVALGVVALFSIPATLITYFLALPTLSISKDFMVDAQNPSSQTFVLQNNGWLAATNISTTCREDQVPGSGDGDNVFDGNTVHAIDYIDRLGYQEKKSIPCARAFSIPGIKLTANFKLTLELTYLVSGLYMQKQNFTLYAIRESDGRYSVEY